MSRLEIYAQFTFSALITPVAPLYKYFFAVGRSVSASRQLRIRGFLRANKIDGPHMYRAARIQSRPMIASKRRDSRFRVGRQIGQQNGNPRPHRMLTIRRCYRNIDSSAFKVLLCSQYRGGNNKHTLPWHVLKEDFFLRVKF